MTKTSRNPIAFTPLPVTIITSFIYAAFLIALLLTHLIVPGAPRNDTPFPGINITEAWHDLQTLSDGVHPFNSRRNDLVRDWLLQRLDTILKDNLQTYRALDSTIDDMSRHEYDSVLSEKSPAIIFNDMTSNVSSSSSSGGSGISVYFEGTNIIVYIRGSEDDQSDWWLDHDAKPKGKGGVLVNAHYDSVSLGYGATDDGVGVVSILQLVKYFTTIGQQPKKGVVALFNNGEEDFLNGARAFTRHPMSKFVHTFLNLEGAGAGGRATLFRTTDAEVTRYYQGSKYPFGTVLSRDGFARGYIKSQTDYIVFDDVLGLRGLDVAFFGPRSRYHTDQDDARHTSKDSLWNMLSAAITTMQGLTGDTGDTFEGKSQSKGKNPTGSGSDGVWFDLFGRVFAVLQLRTLFALSVTLLVVAPLTLIVLAVILAQVDKLYLFNSSKHHHHSDGDDFVSLQGWRGFFRYPIMFVLAVAGVVGLAFLTNKLNPYIVYSSPYSVWSMMLSAWVFIMWFFSRAADFVRPTAFHRSYALLWTFIGSWIVLIGVTVLERMGVAAGYFIIFYTAAAFLGALIAFLELFGLPKLSDYANEVEGHEDDATRSVRSGSISSSRLLATADEQTPETNGHNDDNEEEPTETTNLLRSGKSPTFANYSSSRPAGDREEESPLNDTKKSRIYGYEQAWSWSLPTWTWLIQFILVSPVAIVLTGQLGLLATSATYQTLADGSSPLTVYIGVAIFTTLIFAPLGPVIHRVTYHIPTFLLCVFAGTLIYNLLAFPFSGNNRLKLYFIQRVDLDTGINEASLSGIGSSFMDEVIYSLPSVAGQAVSCSKSNVRPLLTECAWNGLSPSVVPITHPEIPPQLGYADWISVNVTRLEGQNAARFHLFGRNTRGCKITFNRPVADFTVDGAADDSRFERVPENGSKEIRLWSRTWEKPWDVDIRWDASEGERVGEEGLDGKVICLWNDEDARGRIPALDEVRRFAPDWVAIANLGSGLVEGSKSFLL